MEKVSKTKYLRQRSFVVKLENKTIKDTLVSFRSWLRKNYPDNTRLSIIEYRELDNGYCFIKLNSELRLKMGTNILVTDDMEKHTFKIYTYNYYVNNLVTNIKIDELLTELDN